MHNLYRNVPPLQQSWTLSQVSLNSGAYFVELHVHSRISRRCSALIATRWRSIFVSSFHHKRIHTVLPSSCICIIHPSGTHPYSVIIQLVFVSSIRHKFIYTALSSIQYWSHSFTKLQDKNIMHKRSSLQVWTISSLYNGQWHIWFAIQYHFIK